MSSEVLAYLFAQSYILTGAHNVSVTDSAGTNTRNLNVDTGTHYYRTFLAAQTAGVGTEAAPSDLLYTVETQLNAARWSVRLRSNGLVRITYLGAGTGTITWSSTTIRKLLGFSGTVGPLATNAYTEGDYLPTHCIFAIAFNQDSGFRRIAPKVAGVELPTGVASVWSDRTQGYSREGTIILAPRDWSSRTTLDAAGTPMMPVNTSLWLQPASASNGPDPAQTPPWSISDQLGVQLSQRWGCAFGDLQTLIAGTTTAFDVCSVRPGFLKQSDRIRPSVNGYNERWSADLELRWITVGAHA